MKTKIGKAMSIMLCMVMIVTVFVVAGTEDVSATASNGQCDVADAIQIIQFDGIVTSVSQPAGVPDPGLFSVGDVLQGRYKFDPSTLRTHSLDAWGIYSYINTEFSFTLGGHTGGCPVAVSLYGDNTIWTSSPPPFAPAPRDIFTWFARQEDGLTLDGLGDYYLIDLDIWLEDFTGTAVPPPEEGTFLVDPPDLTAFSSNQFVLTFCAGSCPADGFEVRGTIVSYCSPEVEVDIDIKPGSDPNSINCNNENEVIPVAILTTEDFDATTVDHTTVTFEGASETHVDKKSGEPRRHEEDVDGDGDIDLVFHFRLGDTGLTCDSTEGTLTGETFDGQAITGTDAVRMIDQGGGKP